MKSSFAAFGTFTLCLLLSCVPGEPVPAMEPIEALRSHRDKDLSKLTENQKLSLIAIIQRLFPDREYYGWFDYEPQYVWEFGENENRSLVLFEANTHLPHPGSTLIRISLIKDQSRKHEVTFTTGHRCYLTKVSLEQEPADGKPVIVLGTGSFLGPPYHKQYYAGIGDRFDLIRIEDHDGNAIRNFYYVSHFACGPKVLEQTASEWEADVLSRNRFRVLRALVWLGGSHWRGKVPTKDHTQHENAAYIKLVRELRQNKKVIERIRQLIANEDRWLREAAALAIVPEDSAW